MNAYYVIILLKRRIIMVNPENNGSDTPDMSWSDEVRDRVLKGILDDAPLYSPDEQRRIDLQDMLATPASEMSTEELLEAAKRFHPDQH
jgi:hypothetical protein